PLLLPDAGDRAERNACACGRVNRFFVGLQNTTNLCRPISEDDPADPHRERAKDVLANDVLLRVLLVWRLFGPAVIFGVRRPFTKPAILLVLIINLPALVASGVGPEAVEKEPAAKADQDQSNEKLLLL